MDRVEGLPVSPRGLANDDEAGEGRRLTGMQLPDVSLHSTDGAVTNVSKLRDPAVLFFYPMMGSPDRPPPEGWGDIPGARGCTSQACNLRDNISRIYHLGIQQILGISSQGRQEQIEAVERLGLPYALVSDANFEIADRLRLPTFRVGELRYHRRLSLLVKDARIEHVFYPVVSPDRHAEEITNFLEVRGRRRARFKDADAGHSG